MSVETVLLSEIVREGSPKRLLQEGITTDDFLMNDEEAKWIFQQYEKRKPISIRRFKRKFPDFDILQTSEKVGDLIEELKQERAFVTISSALDEVGTDLDHENALDKALQLKEILSGVIRSHSPASDVLMKSGWEAHMKEMKNLHLLRENGEAPGIATGLKNLDFHLGGLRGGKLHIVLGRPGDSKSYFLAKLGVEAMLDGRNVGFFSPEMDEFEHRCRISTLLSANKKIQEELGLDHSFRNRALMDGRNYNLKSYKRFLGYCERIIPGEMFLFTQKYRRSKMSIGYIEGRVDELNLDVVFIDPIYKLKPPTRRGMRQEELADLTDQIQDMAKAFNIPVIVTNQATRNLVGARDSAPHKDSSFGSDAPAQEADYVIGVKYYEDETLLRVRCSKSRFGKAFSFEVHFNPNTGFMEDVTPLQGSYYNGSDDSRLDELREVLDGKPRAVNG